MNSRNVVAALMALLALVCALYVYLVGGRVTDDGVTTRSATTPAVTATASSPGAGKREDEAEPAIAAERPRLFTLLDRYVQSINLLDLVTQLRAAADAGDADAARMIAKALDECYPFLISKTRPDAAYVSRQFDEPERSIALAHLRTQDLRCGDLVASGQVTVSEVRRTDQRAKDLGDLAGQAMRLVTVRSLDPAASKGMSAANVELARKIALSRDPEAIAVLGHSEMKSEADFFAWQLVACDLGRDCGADGYVMRQLCLWLTQCVGGDYREYLRRRQLAPDQYQAVLARERQILQAINSGDVSAIIP